MDMRLRRSLLGVLACGLLLLSQTTDLRAQGGPVDIQMFKPAMDSKGHFNVDSTQVLGPWNTSIGLLVNYAYRPLVLKGDNDRFFRVNDLVGANIQFAIGMFKLSKRGKRSSPTTTAIFRCTPAAREIRSSSSPQPSGLIPPALLMILVPVSPRRGRTVLNCSRKSCAYPSFESRSCCFCRIDIVISARKSCVT